MHDSFSNVWGIRNTFGVSIASEISIDSICIQLGDVQILSDITLNVKPGEIIGLLGPSGSGKTTLMRILAGLEVPCSGNISIDGKIMCSKEIFVAPEKRGIGLMFQDYALFPHLTILNNIKFGLDALPGREAKKQAKRALFRVGLSHCEKLYPYQLSGGEQQRVALARALAPRPGILLMDEPFSGLDARLRASVREQTIDLLRDIKSTVVIVTHDPEEALRVSDRIVLIRSGRIIQSGSCHDLYYSPNSRFTAEFFTELNVFHGVVKSGMVKTPFGSVRADSISEGRRAVVCVRLSDINVETGAIRLGAGIEKSQSILGQVVKRRFMGVVELLEIYFAGHEETIKARIRAGILPGDLNMVSVSAKPSAIMVFEDE